MSALPEAPDYINAWGGEFSYYVPGHDPCEAAGVLGIDLDPDMDWRDVAGEFVVGAGVNSGQAAGRRLDDRVASSTPVLFRDALIDMARSASRAHELEALMSTRRFPSSSLVASTQRS